MAVSVLAVASTARPQFVPGYAEHRMYETFQVMKNNVGQISEPVSEKEHWQANVAMWQIVLNHLKDSQNTNTKLLKDSLQLMEDNVNRITEPSERERWDDNVELWHLMITRLDDPTIVSLGLAQVHHALGEMDANVCCIAETHEHDLWQLLVARWANQAMPIPTL